MKKCLLDNPKPLWRTEAAHGIALPDHHDLITEQKLRHGNVENCRLCRWRTHSQPMEKDRSFPTVCKQVPHSNANMAVYAHSHNACFCEYPSYPFLSIQEKAVGYSLCPSKNKKEREYTSLEFHRETVLLLCVMVNVEKLAFIPL